MTGLEPHPILTLPTREQVLAWERALGREAAATHLRAVIAERRRRMELERADPLRAGYEPMIWGAVDDMLTEGKRVCLLDYPGLVPAEMRAAAERFPDQLTITGTPSILITGSNRSSKSEYAGKKCVKVLHAIESGRGWSFADTESISIARQQPILFRYLPKEIRDRMAETGKTKDAMTTKVGYSQATGFVGQTFVLPNKAQHWFKNYAQKIENMEGDQLDVIWLDELRDPELLSTLEVRLGDRGGLMLVTFTSIDENYTVILDEYETGARTILEVPAELLPIKDAAGRLTGQFEPVPRVKIAGPGAGGNRRARIVYFHITDNPYYGYTAKPKPGERPLFGKERFYKMWRNATRAKILSRVYGILVRGRRQQFNFNSAVHVASRERVAAIMREYPHASRFHLVDPCSGRNWFMTWSCHWAPGKVLIYREWPSHGHPAAYIPAIGDPGPWALPGKAFDGEPGPAQSPFRMGLEDYRREILRCEGAADAPAIRNQQSEISNRPAPLVGLPGDVLKPVTNPWGKRSRVIEHGTQAGQGEPITERWIDCRYGNAAKQEREGTTTLIEQMADLGMEFKATTAEKNILAANDGSIDMINNALAYDPTVPLGEYSPTLARINEPNLLISQDCPNTIYALQNWTGKDGQKGACKDPIDNLRGLFLSDLDYISEDAYTWSGGGSY